MAMFNSIKALSLHSELLQLVSKRSLLAINGSLLYRFVSARFLPISVLMYQPLKAQAVNSIPPQSNIIEKTAGTGYHFSLRSLKLVQLGCKMSISCSKSDGISNHSGSSPLACRTNGRKSYSPYFGFQPRSMQILV
jgi:hypothetical protein